jgi:hypothetical protein
MQTESRFTRVAEALAVVLAVASGVTAIMLATPWWVPGLSLSAAVSFGALVFRGYDLRSARVFSGGLLITVILTLAARGAWDLNPFGRYAGEFVVVGGFVIQPSAVPTDDGIGPVSLSYGQGDTVIVDCKTHGIKASRQVWYRVKDEHVFLKSTSLVPSFADPPGTPPDC